MIEKQPAATRLRWGLLAAGRIAEEFASGVRSSETGELRAVAARDLHRAQAFATRHEIPVAYGSYQELLADSTVDIVYISTPHSLHAEWAIKAANAAKHVLVEKPVTMSHAQAEAVFEAARLNDVFLMEAYMYRIHPQMERLVSLIREGAIGTVRAVDVNFNFDLASMDAGLLGDYKLAGGAILDVGGYAVSTARTVVEAASGLENVDALDVKAIGHIGKESRVDEYSTALMRFPNDILATLSCGYRLAKDPAIRIYGTEGQLTILRPPWLGQARSAGDSTILVERFGKPTETMTVRAGKRIFTAEVDYVAANIANRQAPLISWASSLANMRALDQWRREIGLVYERETEEGAKALPKAVGKRERRPAIASALFEPLGRQLSRLVLGTDAARDPESVLVLWDHYLSIGGNTFDSAWIYNQGTAESRLGWWIDKQGVRKDVILLDKGAHTPIESWPLTLYTECTPDALSRQHFQSLERLRTDYIDIYMLHRDNQEVPVGEFIDVLNQHKEMGTIRSFGASNWSRARLEEANAYAANHGLQGFCAVSNQLSLAGMVREVYAGAISFGDPDSRAWLAQHKMGLFPWSSQARGFFLEEKDSGYQPKDFADRRAGDIERHWSSPANLARKQRARELGKKLGSSAMGVALAWVLHQPFPAFPLIGPRSIHELNDSAFASALGLTADQMLWLESGGELPAG
jgi:predicted dehydrogenase/aryl-alcohol dehydrogenase-like predicted oxidoreductase